jgi:peptide/nickel transport system substrate-binding protein
LEPADISSTDGHKTFPFGTPAQTFIQLVYSSLVSVNPVTQKPVMHLAQSLTSNTDATVWTITLRPNLQFSDGTPLNAAAVVSNWNAQKNPASQSACLGTVTGLGTYAATNATTVTVTLPQARVGFPWQLAGCLGVIQSPTAMAKYGSSYGSSVAATAGAGPYILKSWVPGSQEVLTRNPHYWDSPRPYINTITMKPVLDLNQQMQALQAGQGDMAINGGPTQQIEALKSAGYTLYGYASGGGIDIAFNAATPGLNDVRIRRALVLAVDLDRVNQEASGGAATTVTTFFPPGTPQHNASVVQQVNNLAQAQQLINQYDASHPAPHLIFQVYTGGTNWADPVVQQWAQLKGITIQENVVSTTKAASDMGTGNFQIAFTGLTGSASGAADPEQLYNELYSTSPSNVNRFKDPAVDAALTQLRGEADAQKQYQLYTSISQGVYGQVAGLFLYRSLLPLVIRKGISGITPYTNLLPDFSMSYISSS